MLKLSDFKKHKNKKFLSNTVRYVMTVQSAFAEDVELDRYRGKEIENEITKKLIEQWNDEIYLDVIKAIDNLQEVLVENVIFKDFDAERNVVEAFMDVLNLCQIQALEENNTIN